MLPEAVLAGLVMAVAGGLIGGFLGRALASPWVEPAARPRWLVPAAGVAAVAVFAYAAPISSGEDVRTHVELREVKPPPEREVEATVRIDPPEAAEDARWLTFTAWQGGGSVVDRLEEKGPGLYESTKPIPVYGNWKVTLRLHKGSAVQGAAVYFPEDRAIPAPGVAAPPRFTREFQEDKKLLQREQKDDVPGFLTALAYLTVLVIAVGLVAALSVGLARLDRTSARRPAAEAAESQAASAS
jgi:hypothetical protein